MVNIIYFTLSVKMAFLNPEILKYTQQLCKNSPEKHNQLKPPDKLMYVSESMYVMFLKIPVLYTFLISQGMLKKSKAYNILKFLSTFPGSLTKINKHCNTIHAHMHQGFAQISHSEMIHEQTMKSNPIRKKTFLSIQYFGIYLTCSCPRI